MPAMVRMRNGLIIIRDVQSLQKTALAARRQLVGRRSFAGFTRFDLVALTASVFATALIFLILLPSMGPGGLANRAVCSVNIRSLIQSMIMYAQDNNNQFPAVSGNATTINTSGNQMFPAASGPTGNTYANKPGITTLDTAPTPQAAATSAFGAATVYHRWHPGKPKS